MAKEASKARPGRVNIVISDGLKGNMKNPELPFKVLVMDDFTQRADSTPIAQRKAVNIDKNKFNEVMASFNLSLTLSVPDTLNNQGEMPVTLRFNSLDDFRPEAIVKQVPQLQDLLTKRNGLKMLRGQMNEREFVKALSGIITDPELAGRVRAAITQPQASGEAPPAA